VRAAFALAAALLLEACSLTGRTAKPFVAAPEQWLALSGSARVQRDWWNGFGDPVVTRLVDEALLRNLDVRQAAARVAEARALTDAQYGATLPSLDFAAAGQRSRSIHPATGRPFDATVSQPQFIAAYEVDVWGRLDSLVKAARASTEAAAAARDAISLSVSASVAAGYFNLRNLDAQLELAHRTVASRERSLALTRSREQTGYGGSLESAQAEAELRATAQVIPQLEAAAQRQERALNVLLARTPGTIERGAPLLALAPPELPGAGVPSELLRRRPDIASAESQVAAADARLAAARAQLLPSLRLSAALGRVTSSVIRGDPFSVWSIGGSILAPIFNGGQLRAVVRVNASRREQALIDYERAVLTSFSEVETQLTAFVKLQAQMIEAEAQRGALETALRIAHNRYREGYSSYLDELLAQRNLFAVEQSVLQLHADLLSTQVNLYRVLGGGWSESATRVISN
jgi:NodT family efflux transporter outer membrane factor (OMF) lipoprotein